MNALSLADALRAGAKGLYTNRGAAELIIAHDTWLGRDFQQFIHRGRRTAELCCSRRCWRAPPGSRAGLSLPPLLVLMSRSCFGKIVFQANGNSEQNWDAIQITAEDNCGSMYVGSFDGGTPHGDHEELSITFSPRLDRPSPQETEHEYTYESLTQDTSVLRRKS
jgi:hypothetical protein